MCILVCQIIASKIIHLDCELLFKKVTNGQRLFLSSSCLLAEHLNHSSCQKRLAQLKMFPAPYKTKILSYTQKYTQKFQLLLVCGCPLNMKYLKVFPQDIVYKCYLKYVTEPRI